MGEQACTLFRQLFKRIVITMPDEPNKEPRRKQRGIGDSEDNPLVVFWMA